MRRERGIACHRCLFRRPRAPPGGRVGTLDFRLPGVTSISARSSQFGYAPKGAVLLHRGRRRHRAQPATTRWPGYPVVNLTLLGLFGLAARGGMGDREGLDDAGFAELTGACVRAAAAIAAEVRRVRASVTWGAPSGPARSHSSPTSRRSQVLGRCPCILLTWHT